MKKLVSILLALAMIMAMATTAFAEENTQLTIESSEDKTYAGYQLLKLTTSLKTGEHHTAHEDENAHTDACYNYAYTVNEKYRLVLQEEVLAKGGNYIWDGIEMPTTAAGVTDEQILKYLGNQTSDEGDTYHTMRTVADRLFRAIQDKNIAADAPGLTGTANIEQGYWMFAETTDNQGNNAASSLVMVDTKGQDSLTIKPKVSLPTLEKKVKDIDDSEDANISDNAWIDSADHDIADTVPFKLTADLPSNFIAYIERDADGKSIHPYKMIFHDTLSAGLDLKEGSVKVYMYETLYKANVDTDVNDGADVTNYFTVKTEELTDGCSFEVICNDVIGIPNVGSGYAFVVYYEAKLNENAVIGADGNPNEAYLEFSNDPYGDSTGKTAKDKVTVFTYQLIINKVDIHNHALKGAGFTLYKKDNLGQYNAVGTEIKGADITTFTWKGLDDGDYKLEETTVPEGYNKMDDILFSVTAGHSETATEPALISLDGGVIGTGVIETGAITKDIVNKTGTVLPETGAEGTFLLLTCSSVVVMIAVVFMVTRKRMSIYED